MAAGCPAKCAKFLLIVFNIIFWLCGAALLGFGIWLIIDAKAAEFLKITSITGDTNWLKYGAYALIAVGAFMFITGFAGCCGAIKESPCLLGIYIFLVVLVMLIEIAAGVLGFIFRNKVETLVSDKLLQGIKAGKYVAFKNDSTIRYTELGSAMNYIQYELKCCGINGPSDYSSALYNKSADEKPYACYKLKDGVDPNKAMESDVDKNTLYTKGCKDGLESWFEKYATVLIGLAIGIACLELFGIIFAVCVCRNPTEDFE